MECPADEKPAGHSGGFQMDSDFLKKVESKEQLAILTDENNNIVWQTNSSPVAGMYRAYFQSKFAGQDKLILYANQAGMAVGVILDKLHITECHSVKMSECGLKLFEKSGIKYDYEELIPLVKSSKDESKVCPIEAFLSEHADPKEQWDFLENRFKNSSPSHNSCEWKHGSK
jgi:hypothetical protein